MPTSAQNIKHDLSRYGRSLLATPRLARERIFATRSLQDTKDDLKLQGLEEMKRTLTPLDLLMFGIGIILGAGVFVVTAQVAHDLAGPAVIISYCIAGVSALLSSFCYAEYAVDYPIAGGAYTYISLTFGEFLGWVVVANLILEYVLANAAVARSFSGYFASLINLRTDFFIIHSPNYDVDFLALGLVLVCTAILCYSTKDSSTVNLVITVLHLAVVLFIIVAGLVKAKGSNMVPFAPFGGYGVFNGAAICFFSYLGFDAVATMAEECKEPSKALPVGIVGSLVIVTTFYIAASLTLVLMVPIDDIDTAAGFSAAFSYVGMDWAKYIVALGALLGIMTGVLVGSLGVARLLSTTGREHLVPGMFAYVHPKLGTPIVSTIILGILTAVIALLTSFASLANMVSICTLFVFWVVACGTLYRRYCVKGSQHGWVKPALHILWIIASSVGLAIYFQLSQNLDDGYPRWLGLLIFGVSWIASCISMFITCPQAYKPLGFAVPAMPFLPAASIVLNTFLLGTISAADYRIWGIFIAIIVGFYFLYGLHASSDYEEKSAERRRAADVELAHQDGKVPPAEGHTDGPAPPAVAHLDGKAAPAVEPEAVPADGKLHRAEQPSAPPMA